MAHEPAHDPSNEERVYNHIVIPWQRQLLTKLIQVFSVLGILALLPGIYASLQAGALGILVLDALAYGALLPAYLLRKRWYQFSAIVVVVLQLAVGTGLLLTVGVEAASMLWMLAPMLIGNLLLRTRGTIIVFGVSLTVVILVTVLLHVEALPWTIPMYAWYAIVGTYITLAVILTLATRFLMNHLLRGILYEQELNHELDHRVRNNLQLINSLISLQSQQSGHTNAEEALSRLNTRILAMSAAFSAANRRDRSFRVPLSQLLDVLFGAAGTVGVACCNVEVGPVPFARSISIDTAVPVAIILAEMVVAGSYCEPEAISVTSSVDGPRNVSLCVRFHHAHHPTEPLITDALSQDIVTALADHVAGFYTETPRDEDIELSLTFQD